MQQNETFLFECAFSHKFMLKQKQILKNIWCSTCNKMKAKLKKKVKQENLKILSLNSTPELFERIKSILNNKSEDLDQFLEMKMAKEQLGDELKQRKILESSFRSWSSKNSTNSTERKI